MYVNLNPILIGLFLILWQGLHARDTSFPLPDYITNEYPFNMVGIVTSGDPYLGETSTGSGVAIKRNTVLTAAHVFFNAKTLSWDPGPFLWNLRHSPLDLEFDATARSYRVFSDYAEAIHRFPADDPEASGWEQFNLDVAALVFYEDVAHGGSAAWASYRIAIDNPKMIVGYPNLGYGDYDPRRNKMHSTSLSGSPAVFTPARYWNRLGHENRVFETYDLSSGIGASGSPVFGLSNFQDGTVDWAVIGILVGGVSDEKTIAVAIDYDIIDLFEGTDSDLISQLSPASALIVSGDGEVVGQNIKHPSGNIFNQVLLTGPAITLKAKQGQITRVSFMDENEDIVQVEFSGSGTFTVTLDPDTYLPLALPQRYNQSVKYVTGKPSILIKGADHTTFISIFTVGSLNAVNQDLFPVEQQYDALADVQLVEVIDSVAFGGMQLSNTVFSGNKGKVGIDARGVRIAVRLTVCDITASGDATPYLLFGEGSFTVQAPNRGLRITGGDLYQDNSRLIEAISPANNLVSQGNVRSDGSDMDALAIAGYFRFIDLPVVSPDSLNDHTYVYFFEKGHNFILFYGLGADYGFFVHSSGIYEWEENSVVLLEGAFTSEKDSADPNIMYVTMTAQYSLLYVDDNLVFEGTPEKLAETVENAVIELFDIKMYFSNFSAPSGGVFTFTVTLTDGTVRSSYGIFEEEE